MRRLTAARKACARLPAMNSRIALGVQPVMNDRVARAAALFGWYFYYGMTTQGRVYR